MSVSSLHSDESKMDLDGHLAFAPPAAHVMHAQLQPSSSSGGGGGGLALDAPLAIMAQRRSMHMHAATHDDIGRAAHDEHDAPPFWSRVDSAGHPACEECGSRLSAPGGGGGGGSGDGAAGKMCHACFIAQPTQQQHPPNHLQHPSSHYPKLDAPHSSDALQQQQQQPMMHDAGESDDALSLPSLPSHPISSRGVSQTSSSSCASATVASPVTAIAVAVTATAQPVQAVRVAAPAATNKPGRKAAAAKKPVVPPPQRPTRVRVATKRSESDSDDGLSDEDEYTHAHHSHAHAHAHSRAVPQMATIASSQHHVHQAVMATTAGGASPVIARATLVPASGANTGSPLLMARAVSSPSTARRGLASSSSASSSSQHPSPVPVMAVQIPLPPGVVPPQQAKVLTAPPPGGLGSPQLQGSSRRASLKQQPSPLGALVLPPRKNSMTDISGGGGLQSKAESPASASRSVRGAGRATAVGGSRAGGGAVPASPHTPRGRALAAVATASPIITASPVPAHAQLLQRDSLHLHLARIVHPASPTVTAFSSSSGSNSPTVSSVSSPKKRSLNAAYSSSSVGTVSSGSSFDSGGSPKPRMYHQSPRHQAHQSFEFANAAGAGSFVMPAPVPPHPSSSSSSQQPPQHSAVQQALLHARFSAALASSTLPGSTALTDDHLHSALALSGKVLEVGTPPQLSLGHFTPPSPISPLPVHFQNLMDRQDGLHAAAVAAQHQQGADADVHDADANPPYPAHHKLARAGSPSGEFGVYRAVSSHDDDDGSFSTAQYLHSDLHGDDDSSSHSMTPLQNTRNISTGSSAATTLPETPRTQALSHLMSHTGFARGSSGDGGVGGGGGNPSALLLSWEGKDAAGSSVAPGSSWARRVAAGSQLLPPSLLDYGSSPNPPLVSAASAASSSSSLTASAAGVPAFSSAAASSSVFAVSPSHGSMVAPPLPRRALQLRPHDDDDGVVGVGVGVAHVHAGGGDHSPLFLPSHHAGAPTRADPLFGMDMELQL